jgi:hypothetical protein
MKEEKIKGWNSKGKKTSKIILNKKQNKNNKNQI